MSARVTVGLGLLLAACAPQAAPGGAAADERGDWQAVSPRIAWSEMRDTTERLLAIDGFDGPEAVRYDPGQDVYFVANWSGGGSERDADGFISRVAAADGTITELRFMTRGGDHPLHAPRGMALEGDTLWAVDVDGVHGFDRRTGAPLAFHDLSGFEPGFLNDVVVGPDGALWVTDTGASRVYRVGSGAPTIAVADDRLGPPNGIAWAPGPQLLVAAPWGGGRTFHGWSPPDGELRPVATAGGGGRFDGVEVWEDRIVAASQADSALWSVPLSGGGGAPFVTVPGRPADIALDTRRGRVAVPYIALDRVDVWELPGG